MGCPDFTNAGKLSSPVDVICPDIHNEKLILVLIDDFISDSRKVFHFTFGQRAQEYAVLNVFAMVFEMLEQFGPSLIIGYIVGAEINPAVVGYRTSSEITEDKK